jgi:ribosomal protein S24E
MGAGLQNIGNAGTLYASGSGRGRSNRNQSNSASNSNSNYSNSNVDSVDYSGNYPSNSGMEAGYYDQNEVYNPELYPYGGKVGDDKDKKGKKKPQYELKREFKKIEPEYQLMRDFKEIEPEYQLMRDFKEIEPEYQLMRDFKEVNTSDSSKTSTKKYPYGGQVTGADNSSQYATEDATWNTVGQFGAVGKVIQGSANLGNAIGRPVRSKNEEVDLETGKLKNYKSHLTIGGGALNPLTALQTRSKYKGGFGDIDGSGYKNYLEEQARPEFEAYQKEKAEAKKAETMANYITMMNNSQTQNQYPYGGKVGKKKIVEIEKQEVVKDPDGSIFAANAPSHAFGGQKVAVNDGAIIFSDRINVPGENITFAKKAAMIGNDKKKLDELFRVQENYKTNK